jgi:cell division protein ZapA
MHKVQSHRAIRGADRIAVMAAISLASELLLLQRSVRNGEAVPAEEVRHLVQRLNQQLRAALEQHNLPAAPDFADNECVD